MKRIMRLVCLVLAVTMCVAVSAYAMEQDPKASSYFAAYRAYCTATSSTSLTVSVHVIAVGEMDEIGASTVIVQKSSDGTNWTTEKTFTKQDTAGMINTNIGSHAFTLTCNKTSGYYYRAYVTFYAKNSTGTGYRYYYTTKI